MVIYFTVTVQIDWTSLPVSPVAGYKETAIREVDIQGFKVYKLMTSALQ